MLRIRLRRVGKRRRPAYRVVVADARAPRDGAFIETIGLYDPLTEPATVNIDQEKAERWLKQGAQPSETVAKLLVRQGVLEAKAPVTRTPKTASEPKTKTKKKPEPETPETPSAPEAKAPEKEETEPETEEAPSKPKSKAKEKKEPETEETLSEAETKSEEAPSESE